jgi:hypothetical protein
VAARVLAELTVKAEHTPLWSADGLAVKLLRQEEAEKRRRLDQEHSLAFEALRVKRARAEAVGARAKEEERLARRSMEQAQLDTRRARAVAAAERATVTRREQALALLARLSRAEQG